MWPTHSGSNPDTLRMGIRRAMAAGDEREAVTLALQLIRSPAVTPKELLEMAAIGRKWLEADMILQAFSKLRQMNPGNVTLLLDLAANEQFLCLPAEAARHLKEAAPHCATADDWVRLGLVHDRLGEEVEARDAFRKASELDPERLDAKFNLAVCQGFLGEADTAEAIYDDLIQKGYKVDFACQNRSWLRRQTSMHALPLRTNGGFTTRTFNSLPLTSTLARS
jgi:tetratricopeptide (TPR) repeat protein